MRECSTYGFGAQDQVLLIAGLGNPGEQYINTRHNAGFMILEHLSGIFSISMNRHRYESLYGHGFAADRKVVFVKPMSFMNNSGQPILCIARRYKIPCPDIIIIHDDIDLPIGTIKIKVKGGHGGHNGLKSIAEALQCDRFVRVRIGIGRGAPGRNVTDHVLGNFDSEEMTVMDQIIPTACNAIRMILNKGINEAMNKFNQKCCI
ncbi:MAG: aminoacyl-tRNA hydrolase [Desulfobacterales bacterium]|nr:aminoacyl-tRNA hydrolase [Desulfobacterales bacterium]MDD4071329.1 aminoacyl-tRNA hydrolase [Desulfobacterales bacterium]MDD4392987.1 aminoacyl-tRNA hydrolase [Desulfobacterales bacterium]